VMLTSFGVFWGAEGADARWPGSDTALLVIVPAVAVFAAGLVVALRRVVSASDGIDNSRAAVGTSV
ncbi:MAG: hypothetical protein ACRDV3_00370, partial [Acidothermaceae bacterium]